VRSKAGRNQLNLSTARIQNKTGNAKNREQPESIVSVREETGPIMEGRICKRGR